MPYRFTEEAPTADVGFVASGATLEECFLAACEATLATMVANPESVRPEVERELHARSESLDFLLLQLLEELIFYKDSEHLFLHVDAVRIEAEGEEHVAVAQARGEAIDRERHELAGDVKAVTLHQLEVERTDRGWQATVVLDI